MAVGAQVHVFVLYGGRRFAHWVHGEVRHIPGMMSFRVLKPVLLPIRIEMRARRFEVWRIALGILMNMNRVLAGRKALQL